MQAYDIEVAMDDAALKAKMTSIHASNDLHKRLGALDEEVCQPLCGISKLKKNTLL